MTDFYRYKGLPLVRKGNQIYYGNMADEYIIHIIVQSSKTATGADDTLAVSDKVSVKLMATAENVDAAKAIVRSTNAEGLSEALKTGYEWIEKFCARGE
ncbi:hypothetical protein FACS1894120_0740 [Clostridia bacterium]|nr:hypothetical protein FACS1894120_0740 [Clostridia bacterium]